MSTGIGMDAGQREADFAALTTSQMAEALVNLLRALAGKHTERYSDDLDRGMKLLSAHVKQGGLVKQSIIEEAGAEPFAAALREHHVPYLRLQVQTEDGTKSIFFTRGGAAETAEKQLPDDTKGLERAWESFVSQTMERMSQGVQQQSTEKAFETEIRGPGMDPQTDGCVEVPDETEERRNDHGREFDRM